MDHLILCRVRQERSQPPFPLEGRSQTSPLPPFLCVVIFSQLGQKERFAYVIPLRAVLLWQRCDPLKLSFLGVVQLPRRS